MTRVTTHPCGRIARHLSLIALLLPVITAPLAAEPVGDSRYCSSRQDHFTLFSETLQDAGLGNSGNLSYADRGIGSAISLADGGSTGTRTTIGVDYRYTIIGIDSPQAAETNGHLHSLSVPVGRQEAGGDRHLRWYIAPVLSVSSNVLKQPDLIDEKALQLWTGLTYSRQVDGTGAWILGFRSDHRFGPYRVYPVFGYCSQPDDRWQIQLAFPDLRITRFISGKVSASLFAGPDGNRWYVFDRERTHGTDLFYNAIVSGLQIDWQFLPSAGLQLGIINHARRELSYTAADGSRVDSDAGASNGIHIRATFLF